MMDWLPSYALPDFDGERPVFGGGFRLFDQLDEEVFPGDFIFISETYNDSSNCLVPGFFIGGKLIKEDRPVAVVHALICHEDFSPILRSFNFFGFDFEDYKKISDWDFSAAKRNMILSSGFERQIHRQNYRDLFSRWIEFRDYLGKISGEVDHGQFSNNQNR